METPNDKKYEMRGGKTIDTYVKVQNHSFHTVIIINNCLFRNQNRMSIVK